MTASTAPLDGFRASVRDWCRTHVPTGWRAAQTGVSDEGYVEFQKGWFAELRAAGYAVPHWPAEWGGGMSIGEQMVLYQELAAHDAPRMILPFMGIHHAASTLLVAGTDEQRRRHLPAILDGEIWCQGFSEPEAGSDLAALKTSARREGDAYIVNGQKLWTSYSMHADWCLLLVRTDPSVPKRKGITYLLMDMRSPGIELRRIRQANGQSDFCEMFLNDVAIPVANIVGPENDGWRVAQATLSAERGMVMLELAERLGNAGFRWLVEECSRPRGGRRPLDDPLIADRLAGYETEISGLRAMCGRLVEAHEAGTAGPADASIVKVHYSELLQRMTGFGADVGGLPDQTALHKAMSSGFESGAWTLDFIGSWEWTIPGGTNEIQRNIIAERGLGMPREPEVVRH
jgi:alkylation response protein AidB-like acyl-CoA dehydrogenase